MDFSAVEHIRGAVVRALVMLGTASQRRSRGRRVLLICIEALVSACVAVRQALGSTGTGQNVLGDLHKSGRLPLHGPYVVDDIALAVLSCYHLPQQHLTAMDDAAFQQLACSTAIVAAPAAEGAASDCDAMIVASSNGMDREGLVSTVVDLTKKLLVAKQAVRSWKKKHKRVADVLAKRERDLRATRSLVQLHTYIKPSKRRRAEEKPQRFYRLSTEGMYKLALKRNLGYAP